MAKQNIPLRPLKDQVDAGIDGTGSGVGINYIDDFDFETTADGAQPTDWNTYVDAVQATPEDGTGGTANITFLGSSTDPLRDSISAVLTKDDVNR